MGMDTPITMKQKAIYSWRISMNHTNPLHSLLDSCDFIGVVSDRCDNIGKPPWDGLIDCYGISGSGPYVYSGTATDFVQDETYQRTLECDEEVTVELDCDSESLSFKINDEIIYGPLKLPQRDAWYPAVSLTLGRFQYTCKFSPTAQ